MSETGFMAGLRAGSGRLGLLPVVAIALGGIIILKIAHISLGDGSESLSITAASAQEEPETAPAATDDTAKDAGSAKTAPPAGAAEAAPAEQPAAQPAAKEAAAGDGAGQAKGQEAGEQPTVAASDGDGEAPRFITKSEVEVLNRLTERRKELERRAADLELREKLLRATEKRISEKLAELKAIEARIEASFARQDDEKNSQFKSLVTMYENMKPKDAARIFEALDMDVLLSVVEQMRARKMSPILANMNPEVAQRLTIELAARAAGEVTARTESLPVIADRDPG